MSTMKAELVVRAVAMKEAVPCSNVLIELSFGKEFENVPAYIENIAILHVIRNRAYSSRAKYIAFSFFYFRDLFSEGKINIPYISTEDQLVDIGKKHLNENRLQQPLHNIIFLTSTSTLICDIWLNLNVYSSDFNIGSHHN